MKRDLEELLEELEKLEKGQQKQLLSIGRRLVPNLTEEDALQPNDYPELEKEGVLAGIRTVQMAQ